VGGGGGGGPPFDDDYSMAFDGANEWFEVDHHSDFDFDSDDPFTISCWIKLTQNFPGYNQYMLVITKLKWNPTYLPTFEGWDLIIYQRQPIVHLIGQGHPTSWMNRVSQYKCLASLNVSNQWTHLCVTHDGQNGIQFYFDGVAQPGTFMIDTLYTGGVASSSLKNTEKVYIGYRQNASLYAGLNDLAVFNKEFDQSEVTEAYNSGDPADLTSHSASSNLVAYYTFDEAGDDSTANTGVIHDASGNGHDGTPKQTEVGDINTDVP
tara:strand:+ start:21331 stop:22122 length:792 start_codon:yes stop_codon:yes gene_type:complete